MSASEEGGAKSAARLAEALLELSGPEARREMLGRHLSDVPAGDLVEALRARLRELLHVDIGAALETASIIQQVGSVAGDERLRAIGFWAEATVRTAALGEHQQALTLYQAAIERLEAAGDRLSVAELQVARVWALACVGRREEAMAAGDAAAETLAANGRWANVAALRNNLAAVHNRAGDYGRALTMLKEVRQAYGRLGKEGAPYLPHCELNRALALANLGRLEEAVVANEETVALARSQEQRNVVAQAQANLGRIYLVLGHFARALALFDEAKESFLADGRERDALLTRLTATDCYLEIRRFYDALALSQDVQSGLERFDLPLEAAQAARNEALARVGLEELDAALEAFERAREGFLAVENEFWVAFTDLEIAAMQLRQGRHAEAREMALVCEAIFQERGATIEAAQARLVAARAALEGGEGREAAREAESVLKIAAAEDIPQLAFQACELLGRRAAQLEGTEAAVDFYGQAIGHLERLQGRMVVEYRADYLADKGRVYERMVGLQLGENRPVLALEYAERAKSRALLDLLSRRLRLDVTPRTAGDRPLVDELNRLRAERDRLLRRLRDRAPGHGSSPDADPLPQLERRITSAWHKLLERNGDYARDSANWKVHTESAQPHLATDTALVEYFAINGRFLAFVVTGESVRAQKLPADQSEIRRRLQRLWLNLRAVGRVAPERSPAYIANARAILQKLYELLVDPLEEMLAPFSRLIVVPHGALHYLPFAALHDGRHYLLERFVLSYLPGASFLPFALSTPRADSGVLAVGHSFNGALPFAAEEAAAVATRRGGEALLESAATREMVQERMADRRVIHLAAHGEFRADNPLFSGLALADGWLTTLDVFNLPLRASLVTLSACQTGRSVVGGGDELLGLMRAFLSAGAASLVGTHWAVDDRSTALLMETFYRRLDEGLYKAAALRAAQLQLLRHAEKVHAHPYYWAPFFLVGDGGAL